MVGEKAPKGNQTPRRASRTCLIFLQGTSVCTTPVQNRASLLLFRAHDTNSNGPNTNPLCQQILCTFGKSLTSKKSHKAIQMAHKAIQKLPSPHLFPEIGACIHCLPDPLLQGNHRLISEHLPGLLDVVVPRDNGQTDARRSERRLERLFQNWAEDLV